MLINKQGVVVQPPFMFNGIQYPPNIEDVWTADELRTLGLVKQEPIAAPAPTPPLTEVPLWAARAVLKHAGLFAEIDAYIESIKDTHPEYWEVWNMGNYLVKTSPLVTTLATHFNVTDVDALFTQASELVV